VFKSKLFGKLEMSSHRSPPQSVTCTTCLSISLCSIVVSLSFSLYIVPYGAESSVRLPHSLNTLCCGMFHWLSCFMTRSRSVTDVSFIGIVVKRFRGHNKWWDHDEYNYNQTLALLPVLNLRKAYRAGQEISPILNIASYSLSLTASLWRQHSARNPDESKSVFVLKTSTPSSSATNRKRASWIINQ